MPREEKSLSTSPNHPMNGWMILLIKKRYSFIARNSGAPMRISLVFPSLGASARKLLCNCLASKKQAKYLSTKMIFPELKRSAEEVILFGFCNTLDQFIKIKKTPKI